MESLRVPVPGGAVAVREAGTGIPLVFLHGGTGTGVHDWGPAAELLSRRYRTVVLDLRGHGRSTGPERQIGTTWFGLDLIHVLRYLGIPRAVLIGFSAGANALLKLLARQPQRGLALVAIGGSARGEPERVHGILSGPWPSELTSLEHAAGDGPAYWRRLRALLARDWAENIQIASEELRRISCPVLICHGDRDRIQRLEEALHLARTIPGAELFVAPAGGHAVQLDQPELFAATVEGFLRRALPGPPTAAT